MITVHLSAVNLVVYAGINKSSMWPNLASSVGWTEKAEHEFARHDKHRMKKKQITF